MLAGSPRQYDICEPPSFPESCAAGTMPVVGEATCQPVGAACPAGDFPEGLPAGNPITYVKAGAPAGGKGTLASPFSTLKAAVSATANGGIVAIGKGSYSDPVVLGPGRILTLWGACSSGVTISTAAGGQFDGTITGIGNATTRATLTAKNLTVTGNRPGFVLSDTDASLSGVVIDGAQSWGILAINKSSLDLDGVSIQKTRVDGSNNLGRGIDVQVGATVKAARLQLDSSEGPSIFLVGQGSSADLSDVIVRRGKAGGVNYQGGAQLKVSRGLFDANFAFGVLGLVSGSSAELQDVVLRGTVWNPASPNSGQGLFVNSGAKATVTRALVEGNHWEGIRAWSNAPGPAVRSYLTLTDAVVQGTLPTTELQGGEGLHVLDNAEATLSHVLFDASVGAGIEVNGGEAKLVADDLVVQSTQGDASGGLGFGHALRAINGADAAVTRALFDKNTGISISAASSASATPGQLSLTDTIVRGTLPTADGAWGQGLLAQGGVQSALSRCLFDANREVSILLDGAGTHATLDDVVVQDSRAGLDGASGRGVNVQSGSSLVGNRVLVDGSRELGVVAVQMGTTMSLTDVTIQNSQGRDADGGQGGGLLCAEGAQLTVLRGLVAANHATGVLVSGAGSSLDASDLEVRETQSQKSDGLLGRGLGCQLGAALKVSRASFDSNHESGIAMVACGGEVQLTDVLVVHTLAQGADDAWGVGIISQQSTTVMERVEGRANRAVGLLGFGGEITLSSCAFSETTVGLFDPLGTPVKGVADGAFFRDGAVVNAKDVLFAKVARAGLVFTDSTGTLSNVGSEGNVFGLVVQDGAQVNEDCVCSFDDNETPILTDGGLPVPSEPPSTPAVPGASKTPPPPP
jgi:hypothetical protein